MPKLTPLNSQHSPVDLTKGEDMPKAPKFKSGPKAIKKIEKNTRADIHDRALAVKIIENFPIGTEVKYYLHRIEQHGGPLSGQGKILGFKTAPLLSMIIHSNENEFVEVQLSPKHYSKGENPALGFSNDEATICHDEGFGFQKASVTKVRSK